MMMMAAFKGARVGVAPPPPPPPPPPTFQGAWVGVAGLADLRQLW